MSMAPAYTVDDLSFSYGTQPVLAGVNTKIPSAALTVLLGPNGCGKTTLLHLLSGLLTPAQGQIRLQGFPLETYSNAARARQVSLVPQRYGMAFPFRVEEVVMMGRHPYISRFEAPGADDWRYVEEALTVLELQALRHHSVTELSGGELQRVALARSLAQQTPILLLDEPTGNLDIRHALALMAHLRMLVDTQQRTVVLVLHDLNLAARVADHAILLQEGCIYAQGPIQDVLQAQHISAVFGVDASIMQQRATPHIEMQLAPAQNAQHIPQPSVPPQMRIRGSRSWWLPVAALVCLSILFLSYKIRSATQAHRQAAEPSSETALKPYSRIISLYTAHTENLFALGAAPSLIGVSRSESYPPEALVLPVFNPRGGSERLLAASPDLVLTRPMLERGYPTLMQHLRESGVRVIALQPHHPEELRAYWQTLGTLSGTPEAAQQMISDFDDQLREIRQRVAQIPLAKRKRVYFEAMHSHVKTFSPHSIAAFVLHEAGGVSIADDAQSVRGSNIAAYSKERLLTKGEEIDAYIAQVGAMNRIDADGIRNAPGYSAIRAVREERILIVEEALVSRPTPRLIEGIERISKFLYPEIWKSSR